LPTGKLAAVALLTGVVGILINFSHTEAKSSQQEDQLEEISSDLKTAQQIQRRLQPERIPVMKEVEISGLQIPCKEIGGDYYDVIEVGSNQVAVMVADVSGKGISGALVMSNFQSLVHSLAPKLDSPSQLFAELNQAVAKIATMGRFVTFFYGILNRQTKEFTYCNAGHTYPIWCKADGEVTELSEGGLFLGPFPQAEWENLQVRLNPGDLIFIYTDGVTEATIEGTEDQFGEERLKAYLQENASRKPGEINRQLLQEMTKVTGRDAFEDDVTILCLKAL
jgi:sigma-B regulation protein RsbU (phosphoserine phosphatase)